MVHLVSFDRHRSSSIWEPNAITGASLPIIGKSLGHKYQQATLIYSRLNIDPVRASMEKATQSMFGYADSRGKK
ncbi:MAG: hypothetical protein GY927_18640 [bacterium]|nr:hypothetical protein [bacterium]